MKRPDAWIGLGLVVVAIAALVQAWGFPSVPGRQFGAWTFPVVISLGLGLCGANLAGRAILAGSPNRAEMIRAGAHWPDEIGKSVTGFCLVALAPVIYILAAETVGFLVCAAVLTFILSMWLWRGPVRCVILAVLVAATAELVFSAAFQVPLPEGWLSISELL